MKHLPGKPDVVFTRKRKCIFVHGCFWHQHKKKKCLDGRPPKSRTDYWLPKLEKNVERDKRNIQELRRSGWEVLVLWECEVESDEKLTEKMVRFLGPASTP